MEPNYITFIIGPNCVRNSLLQRLTVVVVDIDLSTRMSGRTEISSVNRDSVNPFVPLNSFCGFSLVCDKTELVVFGGFLFKCVFPFFSS